MTDLLVNGRGAVDGTITLALQGEVDLATRALLAAKLDMCVASTTGDVRLDCSALEFIDSSGLGVLVRVNEELERDDRRLILANVGPLFIRLLDITGLMPLLHIEEPTA